MIIYRARKLKARELAEVKALGSNHTDSAILIYDEVGNQLGSTTVVSHDRTNMRIEVQDIPHELRINSVCRLLVMTSPAPCEYQGRITGEGSKKIIALFHGREKENRQATRYKVNTTATIENLVYNGKAYPMHTPMTVELINISKSGVRMRAPFYALSDGDRFQMRMKISDSEKLLIADVIYHADKDNKASEYGCHFLIGSEKVV